MTAPFDPQSWLDTFAKAGGHWMLTSSGPVLGYPYPAPDHLVAMRDALTDEQAEAVRARINATVYPMEARHG